MNLGCATGGVIGNYWVNEEILGNVHLAEISALIENGLLGIYIERQRQRQRQTQTQRQRQR